MEKIYVRKMSRFGELFISQNHSLMIKKSRLILLLLLHSVFLTNCMSQQKKDDNIQLKLFLESKAELDSSAINPSKNNYNKDIIEYPEIPAFYKGGEKRLEQFILGTISLRKNEFRRLLKKNESNTILLEFNIDNQGKVTDLNLIKGTNTKIDSEFLKIIPLGDWYAGEKSGKKTNYKCKLEIQFI
jgi:hypothetical protein